MGNEITRQVKAEVKVVCPEIIVVKSGGKFTCRATAGGDTRPVLADMTDAKGHFDYRLG